jgi:hypothetical protein
MKAQWVFVCIFYICTIAIALTANAYEDYDPRGNDDDHWELGTPDNIPETEVIIMGDCGCPE